jgi:hypothetical protein
MFKLTMVALATVAGACASISATATEGGAGMYPNGAENYMIGALPPPGTYLLNYSNYYGADELRDGNGNKIPLTFDLKAFANVTRIVHVTDKTFLGASYAIQILVPLVSLDVEVGGRHQSRSGLGDVIINPMILGWHNGNWHTVLATDIFLPVGRYDKNALANPGRNYYTIEPVFAVSYLQPGGWDISAKIMYDINFENSATDYRSGQELHVDFGVGRNFGNWTFGLNGYAYRQTTDDKVDGQRVAPDGNRGRVYALGPAVKYQSGKLQTYVAWQREFRAENRSQGDKLWLKFALPL